MLCCSGELYRTILVLLFFVVVFFVYMRISRKSGFYPFHKSDQPDMEVSVARLIQQRTN